MAKMFRDWVATFFGRWGSKKKSSHRLATFFWRWGGGGTNVFGVCGKFFGGGVANKFVRWQFFLHATRDEESPK